MKPAKPPDLPPKVARGFVEAMNDFFAEPDPHKRDAIAAHRLSVLGEYQHPRRKALRLSDIKGMFREMKGIVGYMWETQADAEAFYSGPWRDGIRARYGFDPKILYFETVALTDKASGRAGAV